MEELFSKLEALAFKGKWDKELKDAIWKKYNMSNIKGTSPEHARLQFLIVIYSAAEMGGVKTQKLIEKYKKKYL